MVSSDSIRYAIGNLLAGPGQWKKMYATGSSLAFTFNLFSLFLFHGEAFFGSSPEALNPFIEDFLFTIINSLMPPIAFFVQRPVQGILGIIAYIIVGLFYWTAKYEASI